MTKIMLVEDDKSLREIYGVRLLAEGYDIVSAGDGEEALAMAIKERPQLIVSDVMMPKISGFDMLDILRSTTETKEIKVIMMTALSSEEQRTRGESLGADRYLVKSQVGIEDVVRVVHEVLGDNTTEQAAAPSAAVPTVAAPAPQPAPQAPAPQPAMTPTPPVAAQPAPQPQPIAQPATQPIAAPSVAPAPQALPTPTAIPTPMHPQAPAPQPPSSTPKPPSQRARIIQPLNDPSQSSVDFDALLNKELEKEAGASTPQAVSTAQEEAIITQQLANFASIPTAPAASTSQDVPETPASAPAPQQLAASPTSSVAPAPSVNDSNEVPGITIGSDGSVTLAPEETSGPQTPPQPPTPQQPAA